MLSQVHLLDGFLAARGRLPVNLEENLNARDILRTLRSVVDLGVQHKFLQSSPHVVLLNLDFYAAELKPLMAKWLALWLSTEHVAEVPDGARTRRGLGMAQLQST